MNGCRAFKPDEYDRLLQAADPMERCLVSIGVRTGFRISELLSLLWTQVLNADGTVRDSVEVPKRSVKGQTASRRVPLHPESRRCIAEYRNALTESKWIESRVFPIGRRAAHNRLKKLYTRARIRMDAGRIATHSLRKSFAVRMYEALDHDLVKLQKAMGHQSINSTSKYIGIDMQEIDDKIRNMK